MVINSVFFKSIKNINITVPESEAHLIFEVRGLYEVRGLRSPWMDKAFNMIHALLSSWPLRSPWSKKSMDEQGFKHDSRTFKSVAFKKSMLFKLSVVFKLSVSFKKSVVFQKSLAFKISVVFKKSVAGQGF